LARKKHFQHGSLFKRGKRNKVWVGRFREPVIGTDGQTHFVRRSEILGNVAELPTRRDAELVFSDLLRRVNSANYNPRSCCSFRSSGVGSTSTSNSQVRNARALQICSQLSPTATVRGCPAALDLAGINPDISRRQNERRSRMADSQASPHNAGDNFGNGGILGLHRRQSSTKNQTPATRPSARKDGLDA
jgi:hypothetical protein